MVYVQDVVLRRRVEGNPSSEYDWAMIQTNDVAVVKAIVFWRGLIKDLAKLWSGEGLRAIYCGQASVKGNELFSG